MVYRTNVSVLSSTLLVTTTGYVDKPERSLSKDTVQIEVQVYLATLDSTGDHFCIIQSGSSTASAAHSCSVFVSISVACCVVVDNWRCGKEPEAAPKRDIT